VFIKDIIMGAFLASLFVVFVLISLLSVDHTKSSGLVTSQGKISDSGASVLEMILLAKYEKVVAGSDSMPSDKPNYKRWQGT